MNGFSQGWLWEVLAKFSKKGHSLLRSGLAHRFHANCLHSSRGCARTTNAQRLQEARLCLDLTKDQGDLFYSMRPRDSFCLLQRASLQSVISITFKSHLSSTYKPLALPPWPTLPAFLHCCALAWKVNIPACSLALAVFVLYSQPRGFLYITFTKKRGLA